MTWKPRFRLYASNGSTLVYEFEHVQNITNWLTENPTNIEITNLRSQGSINIPGGQKSVDLVLQGILIASDYDSLTTKIFSLQSTVVANTNYVLKLDKSPSTTDNINVKRVIGITFEDSQRLTMIKYHITFKTLAW
jgi:hypothetical protein